ncbi:MAG TPA: aspartate-semialdehyde dehydrogenase [Bacteroidota bacterium]|nr:aspartate-semialdehyde dehydrogenase [Bacteroidota bacterium]
MKTYDVIVAGATGMVGRKMIQVLEERQFPVARLIPLASERSVGKCVTFKGASVPVELLSDETLGRVKAPIALFSAGASVSREFSPIAARYGTLVIDNSSAFRMDKDVPLVVPEVNREMIFKHNGIIANPNCSTIQMVVALKPLHDRYKIKRVVVSTYQSVTGAGQRGYDQLMSELKNEAPAFQKFPYQILFNCLPHIDEFTDDGYTKEEHKMISETQKIMGDDSISVSATCVRVPTVGGHSESVNVEFERPFELKDVIDILSGAKGITLQNDPASKSYPMPIYAHDKDDTFVGRVRRDASVANGLNLWIVADNLRKGAATNAVQIAEEWIKG